MVECTIKTNLWNIKKDEETASLSIVNALINNYFIFQIYMRYSKTITFRWLIIKKAQEILQIKEN